MNITPAFTDLSNQFLVAMPGMQDPRFTHTLTWLFVHNAQGAMGITVSRPLQLSVGKVLRDLGFMPTEPELDRQTVLLGGPVKPEMGFVLHQEPGDWESTLPVTPDLHVTNSRDVLDAIAGGFGPRHFHMVLGYAGWSPGQLEQELAQNAWLTTPASAQILFETPPELRWQAAAGQLGVDMHLMPTMAGHA